MAESDPPKQPPADAPPPRRNRTEPVMRNAAGVAATAFTRAGFSDPTLVLRWSDIVGADIARIAVPVRLAEGAKGGILTLKAEPGASLFLQHESRLICERINTFLGRPAVAKLRFVQGPLAAPPPRTGRPPARGTVPPADPALSYSGAEALKAALVRLAAARRTPD